MLQQNLVTDGDDNSIKTMVLVGAELTDTILNHVRKYFEAGWRVQNYCFRAKGRKMVERLRSECPDNFQGVFLDRFVSFLLKDGEHQPQSVAASSPITPDKVLSAMHGNRRYIFMDLDAITQMIVTSRKLFTKVPGAKSAWDIRINFKALTRLVCKNDGAKVQRQVATYGKTNSLLVSQLERYGWKMDKQAVTTVAMAQLEMLEELALSTSSVPSKTLVLLVGNRGQSVPDREKWTRILVTFLEQNWRIEIHSWRESFNTKFLRAFKAYPGQITMTKLDDAVGELLYLSQKKGMGKNTDKTTASTSAITLHREICTSASTGLAIYEKDEVSRHLQAAQAESAPKIQLQEETFEWDLQQDRNEPYHDKYERNNCSQY